MAKFRIELEQSDLQTIFSLMGQGYNGLMNRLSEQLKAGPLPEPPPEVQPKANGAEPPQEHAGNA